MGARGIRGSRSVWHLSGWAVIFFLLAGAWACRSIQGTQRVEDQPVEKDAIEWKTWEEGMELFSQGDYNEAMAAFEFLSESTGDEKMYRRALYGVAVTRLVLAQNAQELTSALELWKCWSQQAAPGNQGEDPRMMTPLVDRLISLLQPEKTVQKEEKPGGKTDYKNRLVYKDAVVYKNLLEGKDKEIARLKSKAEAREKEVRRLRHQIESLEAIHLKYQEKQKAMSSP